MRLLKRNPNGELCVTEDFVTRRFPKIRFEEFVESTGKNKTGYKKIEFCGEQAARDGLEYFWVDTCCIDKRNNTELSEAINSMFQWYHNAGKCYVYLSDVSIRNAGKNDGDGLHHSTWKSAFRKSRWFTRGWALQEPIAPESVEFFSKEGEKLGSKRSLELQIREITGIPVGALRGGALIQFREAERLSWAKNRETTKKEDKVYSEGAFRRLRVEIERASKGDQINDSSISFSLADISETEHFVAREMEFIEIHTVLSGDGSRRIAVLHGLEGIGKTQLAVAYAKRYRDSYSAVFWLNAKDEDSLKQSFGNAARRIRQENPSAKCLSGVDLEGSVDESTRLLVIFDNYDNPKLPGDSDIKALVIRKFLPESYQGSIIITTRSSRVIVGYRIPVRKLENAQDSLEILSKASRREGLNKDPDAMKRIKELDGLPLTLATAGAYLDQVTISLARYLRLYKESWLNLQQASPELSSYEDRMLYSTWETSFKHVQRQNRLPAQLLQLWAYFNNQDIWFELLRHSDSGDPEWIRELTKDEMSFNNAIRVLCNHGLVEADSSSQELVESRGYSMHSCVHSWTRHVLNQEWSQDMAKLALKYMRALCCAELSVAEKAGLNRPQHLKVAMLSIPMLLHAVTNEARGGRN
ncbi:HET-domain-containing protein [Eremomyces bilateralis CBS 781.70]|uniref:HET-domain-containing protein n=1 Tax=Eremomyces bilateralis CBS 781.70 TaxID=1392243 RepID=A0A6G1G8I6_9PEZI|nr:HET-domain-containing protein [Eremomyces bilateralis CBS 781.70]KAF1814169.1 HET-domain-containing protein [Eremomyces bilateralis CBS 781.70]